MKKLSVLVVAVMVSTVGFSQIGIDPEVGLNMSSVRTKTGDMDANSNDAAIGLRAGVGVNIPLYKGLYVKPSAHYNMLRSENPEGIVKTNNTFHYQNVPVDLGYRHSFAGNAGALFAEAGPYIGFALAGNTEGEGLPGGDAKIDIEFGDGITETNPLDWGFNFGVGYETPWGIYVKGSYGLGLGNLSNADNVTVNHRGWNIGIGYRIKL